MIKWVNELRVSMWLIEWVVSEWVSDSFHDELTKREMVSILSARLRHSSFNDLRTLPASFDIKSIVWPHTASPPAPAHKHIVIKHYNKQPYSFLTRQLFKSVELLQIFKRQLIKSWINKMGTNKTKQPTDQKGTICFIELNDKNYSFSS